MHHEVSTSIAAPAEVVWAIMSDVEHWSSWTASITSIELDGPLAVGAKAKVRQPKLPRVTWTVTKLDPGHAFTWRSTAPGSLAVAEHRVAATGPRTCKVTLTMEQRGAIGSLFARLYRGLTQRYMQMEADGLAAAALARTGERS